MLPLVVSRYLSAWYIWSPSAYPLLKAWNLFFPPFIIPPLYLSPTVSWQWSGNVLLLLSLTSASVCSWALSEGFPQPPPHGKCSSACFGCGPQLCWSRSSSTNHMILDSFTAVRTMLQSSCETRCSCCFTSLCLQKATAGSCDTRAALEAPEISALPLYSFFK